MLNIHRLMLRDASTRALLAAVTLDDVVTTVEGTGTSLIVTDTANNVVLVEMPVAHLDLLNHDGIHYVGAGRIRGSRELRHLSVVLELA